VLDAARKHPPTVYCAVPPIYERTAKRAKERGIDLSTAKYCISGAMSLPDSTVALWESVSGGLLVEGYLDDPDVPVAPGERGELLVQGPQVFAGYWQNDEETARTLLPGGWLRTGDIVVVDSDGFTTIVDRAKELIITGGFNVAPSEVEQVLLAHPGVREVAVVGLPSPSGSERIVAAVVPADPAAPPSAEDLKAFCQQRLAGYKVPREFVVLDALPTSMLGKVLRKQVKEQLLARS
jgi:long-chain acyl-CoA synthetase